MAMISCTWPFSAVMLTLSIIWFLYVGSPSTSLFPTFQVHTVNTTSPFTIQTLNNNEVNITTVGVSLNITFWVGRPYLGAIYRNNAHVSVYYNDFSLASSAPFASLVPGQPFCDCSLSIFESPDYCCSKESWLPITVVVASSVPDKSTALAMQSDLDHGQLSITVELIADYRWYIDKRSWLRVKCNDVKVGVPKGVMLGDPQPCYVHWDTNHKWFQF